MSRLIVVQGPAEGLVVELTGHVTLGREPDNVVSIPDPTLSAYHARIRPAEGRWILEDRGSSNGTWRRGVKITAATLEYGDEFSAGTSVFRVVLEAAAPTRLPAAVSSSGPARKQSRRGRLVALGSVGAVALAALVWAGRQTVVPAAWSAVTGLGQTLREKVGSPGGGSDAFTRLVHEKVGTGDLEGLKRELAGWLVEQADLGQGQDRVVLAGVVEGGEYIAALVRHEMLRACGPEGMQEVLSAPGGTDFLEVFLNDVEWLHKVLASGPIPSPQRTVYYLYCIWRSDRKCMEPLYQTMATALALEKAEGDWRGEPDEYGAVRRFERYKQNHQELRLHASFDDLDTWEMRFALELGHSDDHLMFLVKDRNYRIRDYYGACWACAYRLHNMFGDSIHGSDYYRPWVHRYVWAEYARKVGGVCGTLSHYGAATAKAHGIPAMTAGQPGHCAYVIRDHRGNWRSTYNVAWPTSPHNCFWGGAWTYLKMVEDIYAEAETVRRARRHSWQANLYTEVRKPSARFLPGREYAVYLGGWKSLPDFSTLTPEARGVCEDFDYARIVPRQDGMAVTYTGTLEVVRAGPFVLATASDDGSRFYVDGLLVVDNDGLHGVVRKETVLELAAGRHPYRIEFFDGGGADSLQVEVTGVAFVPEVLTAYELALWANPVHYGIWLEYGDWLAAQRDLPLEHWEKFTEAVCSKLKPHQEAAWNLLHRYAGKHILKDSTVDEKVAWLTRGHRILQEDDVEGFENYPFQNVLNHQVGLVGGEPQAHMDLFRNVLQAHTGTRLYFAHTLDWGRGRFANNPKWAPKYAQVIGDCFRNGSGNIDEAQMRNQVVAGILAASEKEDLKSFHIYSDLAESLLASGEPAARGLNESQVKSFPSYDPFPGELLSANGLIKVSSTSRWDTPLVHRAVLRDGVGGGFFHTDAESNPWAVAVLPGDGEVSGIVLVNRWETLQNRQAHLKVALSEDGKDWQEVYVSAEAKNVWRVDLQPRCPRAKYVRVEVDHGEKKDYFHLRNILVYGKKLY